MLSEALPTSFAFVREHLRAPLTLALLVAIPAFFVLIFASVLGEFAKALGGTKVHVGIGLAAADVLGGDQHGGQREPGAPQAGHGRRARS